MRKVMQRRLGGPEVLEVRDVEVPEPGPTEVLVEVKAAGVNPVDWKMRAGGGLGDPPFSVGWDVSGVVAAVGPGVTRFEVGDEVFGMPRFPSEAAAYADYVTAPSRHLAVKPSRLSHVQAAGLPLAGLTGWQALVTVAGIAAGQRVLIPAAAGGVGHLAVQIAKARGAYVIGTASAAKHGFVKGLGADEVIDYRTTDVGAQVADVDVLLATVAGQIRELAGTLVPGARVVALNGVDAGAVQWAVENGLRADFMLVEPDRGDLESLASLAEDGLLDVHIDTAFPLERVADAHRMGEQGRTIGKIVLSL
ncbi:NADP-dependent oxidoreductase [Streptomyces sp. NPDC005236]|uniref:NADP-dependent oxidoreductase n=1 Tax=Streptomyces sp. NPDC005236 TaxID=3157028 RepID=UPI0033AC0D88